MKDRHDLAELGEIGVERVKKRVSHVIVYAQFRLVNICIQQSDDRDDDDHSDADPSILGWVGSGMSRAKMFILQKEDVQLEAKAKLLLEENRNLRDSTAKVEVQKRRAEHNLSMCQQTLVACQNEADMMKEVVSEAGYQQRIVTNC